MARRSNSAAHRNDAEENRLNTYKEAKLESIQTLLKQKVNEHSSGLLGGVDGGRVTAAILLDAARLFLYLCQPIQESYRSGIAHVLPPHRRHQPHTAAPKHTHAR